MSEENTITLVPSKYGKLGIIHCGVSSVGFVTVAGDPRDIKDGEELIFDRAKIKVKRKGNDYTFTKD